MTKLAKSTTPQLNLPFVTSPSTNLANSDYFTAQQRSERNLWKLEPSGWRSNTLTQLPHLQPFHTLRENNCHNTSNDVVQLKK